MDAKKRKKPANADLVLATDNLHEVDVSQPKRQKRNDKRIDIRAQAGQLLSRKERRTLKRNERRREKRKQSQKIRSGKVKKDPTQGDLMQGISQDDEELNSMMSVLDFSKEAEPRNFEQDTRRLYMKHAKTEDHHFKMLVNSLKNLEENNIDISQPYHPYHNIKRWQAGAGIESV
jgi:hypothetical protein